MTNRTSTKRSLFWAGLENLGLFAISALSIFVYARYLTPSEFGQFASTLAIVEVMGIVVAMSFHDALVQRPDLSEQDIQTVTTTVIAISVLLVAFAVILALRELASYGSIQITTQLLVVMGIALPFQGYASVASALLRRQLSFKPLALRSLVARGAGGLLGITLVMYGAGVWALAVQHVAVHFASAAILLRCNRLRPSFNFSPSSFRGLGTFAAPSLAATLLSYSTRRVYIAVNGVTAGHDIAGLLGMAFRIVDLPFSLIATALQQAMLPNLSKHADDPAALSERFCASLGVAMLLASPILIFLAGFGGEAAVYLFGDEWIDIQYAIAPLALLSVLYLPRILVTVALTALGRPTMVAVANCVDLICTIVLCTILASNHLVVALSLWSAKELIMAVLFAALARAELRLGYRRQVRLAAPTLASLLVATGVYTALVQLMQLPIDGYGLAVLGMISACACLSYLATYSLIQPASARIVFAEFGLLAARLRAG